MQQITTTPDYHENMCKAPGGTSPCVVCGRPVKDSSKPPMIQVTIYWQAITDAEYEQMVAEGREGETQGGWPIGPDCLKKHPELRPYLNGG